MALRVAIGAGRWRLVRLMLVESGLLATFASSAGAVFGWWAAPFVVSLLSSEQEPIRLALGVDWRSTAFGIGLTVLVTVLFGTLPALRASAVAPGDALRSGGRVTSHRRLTHALIGAQAAFCVFVVFVAVLLATTFARLSTHPLGFRADRLLVVNADAEPQPAGSRAMAVGRGRGPRAARRRVGRARGLAAARRQPVARGREGRRRSIAARPGLLPRRLAGLLRDDGAAVDRGPRPARRRRQRRRPRAALARRRRRRQPGVRPRLLRRPLAGRRARQRPGPARRARVDRDRRRRRRRRLRGAAQSAAADGLRPGRLQGAGDADDPHRRRAGRAGAAGAADRGPGEARQPHPPHRLADGPRAATARARAAARDPVAVRRRVAVAARRRSGSTACCTTPSSWNSGRSASGWRSAPARPTSSAR